MSSRTSSRSTLTMVPSTMSPSLKYLIVASIAARKSSAEPMSLTATCGDVVLVVIWWGAPEWIGIVGGQKSRGCVHTRRSTVLFGRDVHKPPLVRRLGSRLTAVVGRRSGRLPPRTRRIPRCRFPRRRVHLVPRGPARGRLAHPRRRRRPRRARVRQRVRAVLAVAGRAG